MMNWVYNMEDSKRSSLIMVMIVMKVTVMVILVYT